MRCNDGTLRCLKFLRYVPSLNKVQYVDVATARRADLGRFAQSSGLLSTPEARAQGGGLCGDWKYHECAHERRLKEDTMQVLVPCMVSEYETIMRT